MNVWITILKHKQKEIYRIEVAHKSYKYSWVKAYRTHPELVYYKQIMEFKVPLLVYLFGWLPTF